MKKLYTKIKNYFTDFFSIEKGYVILESSI